MKKTFVFINFFTLLTFTPASAQWIELNPNLPRVNYFGIDFVRPDTGWAVGDYGTLIRTTNGGANWFQVETGLTSALLGVESIDGKTVIACGDSGRIIRSTDSGKSWTGVQSGRGGYLWNIQMISSKVGWLVGSSGALMKTTDAGVSWVNQQTVLGNTSFWSVDFLDSTFGYVCADQGKILKTTNAGADWEVQQGGDLYGIFAIKALDKMRAVAGGFAGKMVYTTNGGASWQDLQRLSSSINDIAFADSLRGFAIADAGLYGTSDGGRTWQSQLVSVEGSGLAFSNNIGYLVGPHITIFKTTDQGLLWQPLILNDDFTHVSFPDKRIGWTLGSRSTLRKTSNGGLNWERQGNFGAYFPRSMIFLDTLTGFVGADRLHIYKTTDGGITWSRKSVSGIDTTYFITKFFFLNRQMGWGLALYTGILKTTDGGETWFRQLSAGDILGGIHFADSVNGYAVSSHDIYRTTNGGTTWLFQQGLSADQQDVYVSKEQEMIWLVTSQYLYKKTFSDSSWQVALAASIRLLKQIVWLDARHGFVFGGATYETRDGGKTWAQVAQLAGRGIQAASFPNQIYGYGVGYTGLIVRYKDTTVTDLREQGLLQPTDFELFQNYPNPFNPSTRIGFRIPEGGFVSLRVYDILGKEVATLVNEELHAGTYETSFSPTELASGIYYYTLNAGSSTQTKKLILIK